MTPDGLTRAVPPPADSPCVVCGRVSPAAVEVGYREDSVRYACPQHATCAALGPVPDELSFVRYGAISVPL
ncbi:hypothetical protein AB0G74_16950 [Streptomyces sp. NPDC020875]|uniref:hypothetical protein n=1 Tax=Streptomyces sp. NPDC020875 TaxID=3154898 RepID=UPI003407E8A4